MSLDGVRFKGRAPLASVLALRRAGQRPHEIADALGIPRRAVLYICRTYAPDVGVRRGRPNLDLFSRENISC